MGILPAPGRLLKVVLTSGRAVKGRLVAWETDRFSSTAQPRSWHAPILLKPTSNQNCKAAKVEQKHEQRKHCRSLGADCPRKKRRSGIGGTNLADALISAAKGTTQYRNYEVDIDAAQGKMAVYARKTSLKSSRAIHGDSPRRRPQHRPPCPTRFRAGYSSSIRRLWSATPSRTAKQILIQRVREAERERIYDEFIGRVGLVESGTVQQISHGDIILNLGRAEAAVPYKEQIRRERYRQGDAVARLYIRGTQVEPRASGLAFSHAARIPQEALCHRSAGIAEGIVDIHGVGPRAGASEPRLRSAAATNASIRWGPAWG